MKKSNFHRIKYILIAGATVAAVILTDTAISSRAYVANLYQYQDNGELVEAPQDNEDDDDGYIGTETYDGGQVYNDEDDILTETPTMDEDLDYSGKLDEATGDPTNVSSALAQDVHINMSDGMYYDVQNAAYVYELGAVNAVLYSTAIDGMVTTGTVAIGVSDTSYVNVYLDGNVVDPQYYSALKESGEYVVEDVSGDVSKRLLAFTIVNYTTGALTAYDMPDNFYVTAVMRNGETINSNRNMVLLEDEGEYNIDYYCSRNNVGYNLHIVVDHTPPELEFTGLAEDNTARNPVTIVEESIEETCSIYITINGEHYLPSSYELTPTGTYEVTVTDEAGNSTVYDFTILLYFNRSSVLFIIFIVALIVGVIAYLIIQKKRLKVR